MECKVRSVKCGVRSVECKVWSEAFVNYRV